MKMMGVENYSMEPAEKSDVNKEKSSKSKLLEKYGVNLTEEAKKGKIDPVICREKETTLSLLGTLVSVKLLWQRD